MFYFFFLLKPLFIIILQLICLDFCSQKRASGCCAYPVSHATERLWTASAKYINSSSGKKALISYSLQFSSLSECTLSKVLFITQGFVQFCHYYSKYDDLFSLLNDSYLFKDKVDENLCFRPNTSKSIKKENRNKSAWESNSYTNFP